MDDVIDCDELLREANPVRERDLADVADSRFARTLFRGITGGRYRPLERPARSRFRVPVYVAGLVGVVATGASVSYALMVSQTTNHMAVGCYSEARLDAHVVEMAGIGHDPVGAVGACQGLWTGGNIPGHPARVPNQALTACRLPGGGTDVFPDPGGTACKRLGLAPVASNQPHAVTPGVPVPTTIDPVTAMTRTVVDGLSGVCFNVDQAKLLVRGALDQAGLTNWLVTPMGSFSPARPCASPGFDEPNHQVLIVPIPRSAGG